MLKSLHSDASLKGEDVDDTFLRAGDISALWNSYPRDAYAGILSDIDYQHKRGYCSTEHMLKDKLESAGLDLRDYDKLMGGIGNVRWNLRFVRVVSKFFRRESWRDWNRADWFNKLVDRSSTSIEGTTMDTNVPRNAQPTDRSTELSRLVKFANANPEPFGKRLLNRLKEMGMNENDLAASFADRNLVPNQPSYVLGWLKNRSKPSYNDKHIEAILYLCDVNVAYFLDTPGRDTSSASSSATSAVKPLQGETKLQKVVFSPELVQRLAMLMVNRKACIKAIADELTIKGVTAAQVAKALGVENLMPRDEDMCRRWLAGELDYTFTFAHHGLLAALLKVSALDYVVVLTEKLPAPAAPATTRKSVVTGVLDTASKPPPIVTSEETTMTEPVISKEDRTDFGEMLKRALKVAERKVPDLHAFLRRDGKEIIAENEGNTYLILSGKKACDGPVFKEIAAFFGMTEAQLKESFTLFKQGDTKMFNGIVEALREGRIGPSKVKTSAKKALATEQTPVTETEPVMETAAESPVAEEATPQEDTPPVLDSSADEVAEEVTTDTDAVTVAAADEAVTETEVTVEAVVDEPVTDATDDIADFADGDDNATETVDAEMPTRSLEDELQPLLNDYAQNQAVKAEETEMIDETKASENVPAVTDGIQHGLFSARGEGLAAYTPHEMGMLQMTNEQFQDVAEPARAEALKKLVEVSDIPPDLVSRYMFQMLVEHGAALEGRDRRKLIGAMYTTSLSEA